MNLVHGRGRVCRDRIPKLRLIVVIFAICYFWLEVFPGGNPGENGNSLPSGIKVLNGLRGNQNVLNINGCLLKVNMNVKINMNLKHECQYQYESYHIT